MKYIFNHTDQATAKVIDDYPYGFRLRTKIRYWLETKPKKGDRFMSQTLNPKKGYWNKPKASTYSSIGVICEDEKGHIKWSGVNIYSGAELVKTFVEQIGGIEKLNADQHTMYNQLLGINEVKVNEFTGEKVKDYSIKWERNHNKESRRLTITFDRPDGVEAREIYKAMKSANQERLLQMLEDGGTVAICVRGGIPLGNVDLDDYREWLASDENN